jgi:dTDP-4-amino-4,6-dideoxygalactose transaminase
VPTVPLNDLSRTDDALRSGILSDVDSIIRRGAFFGGPFTTGLASAISERFAGRHVTLVGNGTDALYLALAGLQVGAHDRVAVVANAGGYATNAVLRCGAKPRFVDVDPQTAQMAPDALHGLLESDRSVRAVVATHLYGLVGAIDAVREVCHQHDVWLVEDCAQSFGADVDGQAAGTFGDLATLSFYPTKNLGAFGDAGAVVAADRDVAERVAALAQYGWAERYVVTVAGGINSRLDEIQAAVLLRNLMRVDADNARRRAIASRYAAALTGGRRMLAVPTTRYVAHLAVMVTDDRDADRERLAEHGVMTGVHYPVADHAQPGWQTLVRRPVCHTLIVSRLGS